MTTTYADYSNRHAACDLPPHQPLRLQYLGETVAEEIGHLGEEPPCEQLRFSALSSDHQRPATEWLGEPILGEADVTLLALAKLVSFVNVDRKLVDMITDNATMVGDEADRHNVSMAMAHTIRTETRRTKLGCSREYAANRRSCIALCLGSTSPRFRPPS